MHAGAMGGPWPGAGRNPADLLRMFMVAGRGRAGRHDQDEDTGRHEWPGGRRFPFSPGGLLLYTDPRAWGRHGSPFGGPRARRGDVRAAALALLAERPMNGYQIIQEIKERSGGLWKPSSGAVYPALQQLEDEGLVQAGEHDGRRAFSLTEAGRKYVDEHADELAAPWAERFDSTAGEEAMELRDLAGQAIGAFMQVAIAGTPEQVERAKQVINDARRALYRILADEPADDER